MRKSLVRRAFTLSVLLISVSVSAQQSQDWAKLLSSGQTKQARSLCEGWTGSASLQMQVEAEKCLANVELAEGQRVQFSGNDVGGGTLGEGWTPEAVDKALVHLNKGIQLAPQDLSIHQGRLHVLEVSGRFDDMAKALDQSITIYKGPNAFDSWMAYESELGDAGQAKAGLQIAEVLNRHYPNNHEVIGNMGAFHSMLKQWNDALPFLKQAVTLAPNDPLDNWNLGWAYEHLNQDKDADLWMSKAIQLDPAGRQTPDSRCLYAAFVETHLHDPARACKLERASCEKDEQTACTPAKGSSK